MLGNPPKKILLLAPTTTYRLKPFLDAAQRMGIEVIVGDNRCHQLAEIWGDDSLYIDFHQPDEAFRILLEFLKTCPVDAIIPVDDRTVTLAARASAACGLPHNHPEAVKACRNKFLMRECFAKAGVKSPTFRRHRLDESPEQIASNTAYPCVLKPLHLNGSRGVIRANNPEEFVAAFHRLKSLLSSAEIRVTGEPEWEEFLVEAFIPGVEVALEGILRSSTLHVLALFDKPDPLNGPFFEETLYITPSRLSEEVQQEVIECTSKGVAALGLSEGPIHAELRINDEGVWLLEIAGRSIGGKCSKAVRLGTGISLEELILHQAIGSGEEIHAREDLAAGVMMIPIQQGGLLKEVSGVKEARAVPYIEEIDITIRPGQLLVPLPEGSSYLGFIFARARTPKEVEVALREANKQLECKIAPDIT